MIPATEVRKEDISGLKFVNINVLTDPAGKTELRSDLAKALHLGNVEHQKVKILFETSEGTMFTDTTVWNLTENLIILKGNVDVPTNSIHRIEFFE